MKNKADTSVSAQEDDNFTSSPTPGFSASKDASQDEDINTSKASENLERSPPRSVKSVMTRTSDLASNEESPHQHSSLKPREKSSASSKSDRYRSKESVSSDNQENPPTRPSATFSQVGENSLRPNTSPQQKSVRSTKSKQKSNETDAELEKENSHSSGSESDEAPSAENVRKSTSRRSSIARSLLKVRASPIPTHLYGITMLIFLLSRF